MKKAVPIIITMFVVVFLGAYLFMLSLGFQEAAPLPIKIIIGLIGVFIVIAIIGMIATMFIRIKEINKEDEDDISKY